MWRMIFGSLSLVLMTSPAFAGERQNKAKAAGVAWGHCVLSKAERFAPQPEPAETLATAAMGACISEGATFRHLLSESTREYGLPFASRASSEEIDRNYTKIESQIHNAAVSTVIQTRSR